jgi:hypothetical protein
MRQSRGKKVFPVQKFFFPLRSNFTTYLPIPQKFATTLALSRRDKMFFPCVANLPRIYHDTFRLLYRDLFGFLDVAISANLPRPPTHILLGPYPQVYREVYREFAAHIVATLPRVYREFTAA